MRNKKRKTLKRFFLKNKLNKRNKKFQRPETENSEINFIKAFEDLVEDTNSELSYCPESSIRYIENEGFIARLNGRRISIMNGILGYESIITDKQEAYLVNLFNRRVARKCAKIDGKINNKLEKSLSNLLEKKESE